MDFIDLLEFVVRETSVEPDVFRRPESMDSPLAAENTGLNDLEQVLLVVLIGEIYDIPLEIVDAAPAFETPRSFRTSSRPAPRAFPERSIRPKNGSADERSRAMATRPHGGELRRFREFGGALRARIFP